MKIVRNDQEIELTDQEIEQAFREREKYYYVEDVKSQWEQMYGEEFPYGNDVAKTIAERAEDILSKNDGYWDYYWENFYLAMEEFKQEEYNEQNA